MTMAQSKKVAEEADSLFVRLGSFEAHATGRVGVVAVLVICALAVIVVGVLGPLPKIRPSAFDSAQRRYIQNAERSN